VRLHGELERELLGLLDGSRDRAALLAELATGTASGAGGSSEATPGQAARATAAASTAAASTAAAPTAAELDEALAHLAEVGLLAA